MTAREWSIALDAAGYDPDLRGRILVGIGRGVPIDFVGDRTAPRWGANLWVEDKNMAKIDAVIAKDVAEGKKAGPFDAPPFEHFVVSPIGCVPKKASDKVRVIHHLSFPFHGDSVNANIVDEPLCLSSFGQAARAVVRLGRGCLLVKLDVEAAYKQVPVRREDWPLLGFMWRAKYYYERVLPFGLKSSCRLWDLYAAALQAFFELQGVEAVIHYIDDFLFVVRSRDQAQAHLDAALALCERLGIPMAPKKTEGPTTCLTFLGIELDTLAMEARLPEAKLAELGLLTEVWRKKSSATVRELQSLAGMLNFACAVVAPGRVFTRRIFARIAVQEQRASGPHQAWALSDEIRADLAWWRVFLADWNGRSLLYELEWQQAARIELFTDACEVGLGARFGTQWFEQRWSPGTLALAWREERVSIPFLELLALVTAAATWGRQWRGKKIIFRCDATAAVDAIGGGGSSDPGMMSLLRHLTLIACREQFDYKCEHIPGVSNVAADLLSRHGRAAVFMQDFLAVCPNPNREPTPIREVPIAPKTRA
jgi:hypothetical protein